jgi:hypothetical protein
MRRRGVTRSACDGSAVGESDPPTSASRSLVGQCRANFPGLRRLVGPACTRERMLLAEIGPRWTRDRMLPARLWGLPLRAIRKALDHAVAMFKVKGAVIAASILAAAAVLWVRQTPDALLRVESFGGAVLEVAFWSTPTFVLYLLLARSWVAVVGEGVLLSAIFVVGWWSYATDWHSTASLGPAGSGWFVGPAVVVGVRLVESVRTS